MIDKNKLKTIIEFYLQMREEEWGISGEKLKQLPAENTPARKKIDYLCRIVEKVSACCNSKTPDLKEELINLCEEIRIQEDKERNEHRSSRIYTAYGMMSDYPLMAETLKAIRSLIYQTAFDSMIANTSTQQLENDIRALEAAYKTQKSKELEEKIQGKKKALEIIELANFHKSDKKDDYLSIIKYEDYQHGDKSLQSIKTIDDFFNHYANKTDPHALLQQLTTLWEAQKTITIHRSDIAPTLFAQLQKGDMPLTKKEKEIAGKSASYTPAAALRK